MVHNRREFLLSSASFAVGAGLLQERVFGQPQKKTRLILLGTKGGPRVGESGRSNPSTLILINEVPYLVDCGYGATKQLLLAGVADEQIHTSGLCTAMHLDVLTSYRAEKEEAGRLAGVIRARM